MTTGNTGSVGNNAQVNDLPAARRAAVAWAKGLCKAPFVVVDLETTDKDPKWAEPVQIAIVGSDGKTLYKTYVKPRKAMATEAAEKTGITPDMLRDAPTFQQVYPRVLEILSEKTVVAYNASFDQPILRNMARQLGLADPTGPGKWQDAMIEYSNFHGEWHVHPHYGGSYRWKVLGHATLAFNLANEAAHDAEADALATVRVIQALAAVDFDKPQVFQFAESTFTILYPDGKTFLVKREGEGAFDAVKKEVLEAWENMPSAAPAMPGITLSDDEIQREREALAAELAVYAAARVAWDEQKKALDAQEASIKSRFMKLANAGVENPHDALLVKETRKWVYQEALLLELAREHDRALLVEKLDEKQFEAKVNAGLFSWAGAFAPRLQVNRFAAFQPKALNLIAAARQNVAPVPSATEDESWREKIPF